MKLKSLFDKPVDRPIEGVIKADDQSSLRLEVEEYVLTHENAQRLEQFLEAYNAYHGANGAWISGFFGCGKSHLLKMLALLLGNQEVDGLSTADAFLKKSVDDATLSGAIKKAASVPAQSILFNIDQKADVISKGQTDALISVFVKVFDEACGYYGKQGYIAQFERALDEDGLLAAFREAFATNEGKEWNWGRTRVNRVSSSIDKAYHQVTGEQVEAVIDRYKADHKLSIEDFAENVKAYLDRQGDPRFRLNFFVDEVGQYIADNTKLMTNLQTVAESLATKCEGRSWIVVTAQGDMDTVVGEMTSDQANDFSKIQARFKNRLKLTSQNVAEVIQKRLLKKTPAAVEALKPLYAQEQNNFKTLFDFADGGQTYRNFRSEEHFIDCYPFVPYQFDLFQLAIRNLSQQNAFEGRHSSVGERSMLGVFQEVAVQIADCEIGELATFDLMYEGVRTALKTQMQHAVGLAENNLDNPLAVRLLKALFLVKYVREFKPTLRNLGVLMFDRFGRKPSELIEEVQAALQLLETQVYIQRNGELFEFLTDEEKDVEQEIKNTEVDSSDVAKELSDIVFDQVIRARKLRYEPTKNDFNYTRKLDERLFSRECELSVHVVSPFHDEYDRLDTLKMRSMGRPELLVVLPPDDRLLRDLMLYKQTAKYVSQNHSMTQHESVKRILAEKQVSNGKRRAAIAESVAESLGKARMFVSGAEVESNSADANLRLHDGFEQLIVQTYTNLKLLRGVQYSENNLQDCLTGDGDDLFSADTTSLSEAETEMLSRIQATDRKGSRTTVKSLIEDFERKPFGWPMPAILCILAKLCGRGKIEARADSQILEGAALIAALKNSRQQPNIILDPQIDFTPSQVRRLKDFYEEYFDQPARSNEAKALGEEVAADLDELHRSLLELRALSRDFPFLAALDEPLARVAPLAGKPFKFFFTEFEPVAEQLLDDKENVLDPVRRFMSGSQKEIYAQAASFHRRNEPNLSYLNHAGIGDLVAVLADPECFRGSKVQSLAALTRELEAATDELLTAERASAAVKLDQLRGRIESHPRYAELEEAKRKKIHTAFDEVATVLADQRMVPVLRETVRRFEEGSYRQLFGYLTIAATPNGDASSPLPGAQPEHQPDPHTYVLLSSLHVPFEKFCLETAEDIEQYIAELRAALLTEVNSGNRVQI
jgi:hypothetical protein